MVHNPPSWLIHFTRFIDDLFFIASPLIQYKFDRTIALISNADIRYDVSKPDLSQNFLDTTIILKQNGFLSITPFSKDTASGSYLHPKSTHPFHVIRATPYSQFLRIKRISSTNYIFFKFAKKMIRDFKNMGYPKSLINTTIDRVVKQHHKKLHLHRVKNNVSSSFKFISPFNRNRNWKIFRDNLDQLYGLIINHYTTEGPYKDLELADYLSEFSISEVFSNARNLSSHFTVSLKK